MELEFNKIIDRAVEDFRRTSPNPKRSTNKPREKTSVMESKGLPIEPEVSFTLDSTAEKAVKEVVEETSPFEDVQELPDENLEVEVVEDPPEEKRSEETNVKWLEEPTIIEI
ncbi:hypothetical protein QYF36_015493 [Acer negundo]|nr:hypothetical protein QYF36_015493 [Acer negundo]